MHISLPYFLLSCSEFGLLLSTFFLFYWILLIIIPISWPDFALSLFGPWDPLGLWHSSVLMLTCLCRCWVIPQWWAVQPKHLNLPGGTHDLFQHKAGASSFWGRILRSVTAASLVVWHSIVDNLSQPFATSVSPSSQAIESGHVGSATLGTCHKFWLPTGWVSSEDTNMLLWRC